MRFKDVVKKVINDVKDFLNNNVETSIYAKSTNNSWGIYINWTNKSITIHGPNSQECNQTSQSNNILNMFNETSNGVWLGPFDSFCKAYTFASLLKQVLYLKTQKRFFYHQVVE